MNRAVEVGNRSEGKADHDESDIGTCQTEGTELDPTAETRFTSDSEPVASLSTIASSNTGNTDPQTLESIHHGGSLSVGSMEKIGQLPEGSYSLHPKLGSGAMGVVKLVDDLRIHRQVA